MTKDRKNKDPSEDSEIDIMEAVENLNSLADMHEDYQIGITDDHHIIVQAEETISHDDLEEELVHWTAETGDRQTEAMVKETYRTVFKYVKEFHQKEFTRFYEPKNQEGIQKMMLLVGEASEKLDRYTCLFKGVHHKGIQDTREYKQLDNFYKERIAVDEEGRPSLIDLVKKKKGEGAIDESSSKDKIAYRKERVKLVDVDSIREDVDYELIFMKKSDGSRFYSRELIRNIKMVCNFSDFFDQEKGENPIFLIAQWYDQSIQQVSKHILDDVKPYMQEFYEEALKVKDMEIVACVNKMLMALMLSANTTNKLKTSSNKSCLSYFQDFHYYLRQALLTDEYFKLMNYPPPKSNRFLNSIIDLIDTLCVLIFDHTLEIENMRNIVKSFAEEGKILHGTGLKQTVNQGSENILDNIENNYTILNRLLQSYPNGPLFYTLELLEEGLFAGFDAMMYRNLPHMLYSLSLGKKKLRCLRLPSPTRQNTIREVTLCNEFKLFLQINQKGSTKKKHLLINCQDRNSWKELSRCEVLENVQMYAEFSEAINVVTLNHDSAFYFQYPPYEKLNDTKEFISQFKEHLESEESGFYYPKWISNVFFEQDFVDHVIDRVHEFFFTSKNVLSVKERQTFIDITYLFMELKLLEITAADSFSFTCKDSVDVGGIGQAQFYCFMKLITKGHLEEEDLDYIYSMVLAIPMLVRERLISGKRFYRMLNALRTVCGKIEGIDGSVKGLAALNQSFGELFQASFQTIGLAVYTHA